VKALEAETGEAWQGRRGARIVMEGGRLVAVQLLAGTRRARPSAKPSPALRDALQQMQRFLAGRARGFSLRPRLDGSPFQVSVWKALRKVPYGRTISYAQLAAKAGHPGAARAVGAAMAANPLPLVVPCHRVVASNGLGGFTPGLAWKRWLFTLEGMSA
jgi:methylated-DNA-[protein]-cysteine S-methyltransferase